MSLDDEFSLFFNEFSDVKPLKNDTVTPLSGPSPLTDGQKVRQQAASAEIPLLDYLSMEAVELCDPHQIVGFKRDGVQEGVYKKLRLGQYQLQASLDLQQKNLDQARQALLQFIHDCHTRDIRCVLIRHGRGERSSPRALLKSYVSAWLGQLPVVIAMHSADRCHGGSGALYVLLRKSERAKAQNREHQQKRIP